MRVPVVVKIAGLTLAATIFYTYVGQLVPQKEVHPPVVTELSAEMSTTDLVAVGETIVAGKGMCVTCHTIGQSGALRFPDLAGIATRAGDRVAGLGPLEYMAQSLYHPEDLIVPGFAGGMPPIDKPPIGLTHQEIRTVLAYLQTLGGEATMTMETPIPFSPTAGAPAGGEEAAAGAQATAEAQQTPAETPAVVAGVAGCERCHAPGAPAGGLAELLAGLGEGEIVGAIAAHPPAEGEDFAALTLGETREIARRLGAGGNG